MFGVFSKRFKTYRECRCSQKALNNKQIFDVLSKRCTNNGGKRAYLLKACSIQIENSDVFVQSSLNNRENYAVCSMRFKTDCDSRCISMGLEHTQKFDVFVTSASTCF